MLLQTDQGAPRFAAPGPIVARCLAELRFPERVTISEAARRHRVLRNPGAYSGPWSESPHDVTFMERAMDALGADGPYREVAVMGPAQTAKSELGNNWQLHTILYDQADMLFVMPDKTSIASYVITQWNVMLETAKDDVLRARQLGGPSSDNINLKQFLGCTFHFLWPSGPTFRAKPISRGRLDDYDDIPQEVGEQGNPVALMAGRAGSFDAYGRTKIYINSSPALGRNRGIEALVAGGTNERRWVDCLMCGAPFELDCETRLQFDRSGSPAQAAASAEVICPDCGGAHQQQDKPKLLATGRWVGRGETAVSLAKDPAGKTGELEPNSRLSQRWDGLMGFRRWSAIAEQWRLAEIALELEQDEGPMRTFYQTVIGKNFVSKGAGAPSATEDELAQRARASSHRFGVMPAAARCLVGAVDQQGNRFEVAVWAFGPGYRAWLVERFAIFVCGEEPVRPFTRPEHFSVLYDKVLSLQVPVDGAPGHKVKILNTVLDTGGLDGATDNAFAWWHAMVAGDVGSGRAPVPATAITLFKGGNNPKGKLLPPPTIDAKRQIKGAPQAELYMPNVNRLKDTAETCLKRSDGGPGCITWPSDIDEKGELKVQRYLTEMRAEVKVGDAWERPAHMANETWDLYVMARAALLRLGGADHSLDWVPVWARPPKVVPAKASGEEKAAAAALREAQGQPDPELAATPRPILRQSQTRTMTPGKSRIRVVRAR